MIRMILIPIRTQTLQLIRAPFDLAFFLVVENVIAVKCYLIEVRFVDR